MNNTNGIYGIQKRRKYVIRIHLNNFEIKYFIVKTRNESGNNNDTRNKKILGNHSIEFACSASMKQRCYLQQKEREKKGKK